MGRVVFVGAGPGAADLITLRGAAALGRAEVVLCDALTDPVLRDLAPGARWIDVGKRGYTGARTSVDADGGGSVGQSTINALLVRHANEAGCVVRLKGGDPSIFGRLEEEIEALVAAGIDFEIVPGVTAALAAAAASRRPLTRRGAGRSVGFATAMTREGPAAAGTRASTVAGAGTGTHTGTGEGFGAGAATGRVTGASPSAPLDVRQTDRDDVPEARRATPAHADTEVCYMAGRLLGSLGRRLLSSGWLATSPVSVVSRAGWPDALQSDHTVATLDRASVLHAGRPTVVIVGVGAAPVLPVASGQAGTSAPVAPDAVPATATAPALWPEPRAIRS